MELWTSTVQDIQFKDIQRNITLPKPTKQAVWQWMVSWAAYISWLIEFTNQHCSRPLILCPFGWKLMWLVYIGKEAKSSHSFSGVLSCIYRQVICPWFVCARFTQDAKLQARSSRNILDWSKCNIFQVVSRLGKENLWDKRLQRASATLGCNSKGFLQCSACSAFWRVYCFRTWLTRFLQVLNFRSNQQEPNFCWYSVPHIAWGNVPTKGFKTLLYIL